MRRKIGRKQRLLKRRSTYKRSRLYRRENGGSFKLYKSVTNAITLTTGGPGYSGYVPIDVTTFSNWSEIASLYDQYKIQRVRVTLRPKFKSVDSTATNANWEAYVYTIIDRDNPPTSVLARSTIVGYRNRKSSRYGQSHSRSFIPSVQQQMYYVDYSGTTINMVKPNYGYFDTAAAPTISNLYLYIDGISTDCPTDNLTWDMEYTIHLHAKTTR